MSRCNARFVGVCSDCGRVHDWTMTIDFGTVKNQGGVRRRCRCGTIGWFESRPTSEATEVSK